MAYKPIKVVTLDDKEISMWPTDWQFRRSTGGDLDIDEDWNIVPPGHFILFKSDDAGELLCQKKMREYVSRTEAFSTESKREDGSTYCQFYLVEDNIVWCGTHEISPPEESQ